ncbi:hypothetical protein B566_EDAN014908 [Ephemera danica]|nr:hypothetical protein B566_EDAN014908 [Ephemera danica]
MVCGRERASIMKFTLLLCCIYLAAHAFAVEKIEKSQVIEENKLPKSAPKFSSKYTVKGTLYIPYAEIREPFYAWFDEEAQSSRIDYYGGMVKTYQLGKKGDYGAMRKVAPVTTETQLNKETCLQVDGDSDMPVSPQSILPDLTGFECIGDDMVNGHHSEKWRLVEKKGDKVNKYTMWVRYKKSSMDPKVVATIPLRYEMRGFNSLLDMTCTGFPGPGDKHVYTFNPMREFVHMYDAHVDSAFEQFKRTHSKQYPDHKEHGKRMDIFRQNLRYIHSTNRAGIGFQLGVNHLADKTDMELKALRGRQYSPGYNGGKPFPHDTATVTVPDFMDWRIYGAVTPVKVRISQQALIDCSWGYGNNGCDGGEDFRSYQWMMKHGGIPTEDEYGPYLGQDGYCHADNVTLTAKITGYVNVTSGDAQALKLAVAKHGPISVAIDASHKTFSFYSNGVYYDANCGNTPERLDHAVLVVGYGTINGKDYWLVKNSWSNYWGNDGYILMAQQDNNCGVTTDPTYVIM